MTSNSDPQNEPRPFPLRAELARPRDFELLLNGPINGYRSGAALNDDLVALSARGYVVERFDCSTWSDEAAMHAELASRLKFPDYYGRNLDALDDCLGDTDVLAVPAVSGLAVTFEHLDSWDGRQHTLLDIWAGAARYWSLFGRRIVVLVSVTDAEWIPPTQLGATRFWWQR